MDRFIYILVPTVLCSRGIFEFFVSKHVAYAIQALALMTLLGALVQNLEFRTSRSQAAVVALTLFVIALMVSMLMSLGAISPLSAIAVALANLLNISFLCLLTAQKPVPRAVALNLGMRIAATVLIVGGVAESMGVLAFERNAGFGEVGRLAGPPSSIQHYSFLLAICAVWSLKSFLLGRKIVDFALLIGLSAVLFAALTRVGYLVFFVALSCASAFFIYDVVRRGRIKWTSIAFALAGFGGVVGSAWFLLQYLGYTDYVLTRLGQFTLDAPGNSSRFLAWSRGVESFLDGSILLSDRLGTASQIPSELFNEFARHYESGHLQILVNFGLIGWLLFMVLVALIATDKKRHYLERGLAVAMVAGAITYMWNEVVPIAALFVLACLPTVEKRSTARLRVQQPVLQKLAYGTSSANNVAQRHVL